MSERLEGRLHPVTPLRKSWTTVLGLGTVTYQFVSAVKDAEPDPDNPNQVAVAVTFWDVGLTAVAVVAVVVGLCFLGWRASFYRLDGNVLQYRFGLLFKTDRRFELDHVQSVDIARPLLGRLLGVCTLNVRMTGTGITLSYLTLNQARALKARILDEEADGNTVYQVRTRDLVISLLLDVRTNLISLIVGAIGLVPYITSGSLFALGSLIAVAPRVWRLTGKRLFVWHAWSVTQTDDDAYRIDYGMFDTRQYTYRSERVASVTLHQPILWRRLNWVRVKVAIAGAARPGVLLPVAPRHVAEKMVAHLLGDHALAALDNPIPADHRARRCSLFHKAHGYRMTHGFFAVWNGIFLHQMVSVAPLGRIQLVTTGNGPWLRATGLADVTAVMAGGNDLTAHYRDIYEASIVRAILTRASQATARKQVAHCP